MIGVECTFAKDGRCQIKRIQIGEQWQLVEQGRQWLDPQGRHVLVRLMGQPVQELVLRPDMLRWELRNGRSETYLA